MLINKGGRNNKKFFGSKNIHNMAWADLFATKNVKTDSGGGTTNILVCTTNILVCSTNWATMGETLREWSLLSETVRFE